jgi:hypothetical protein
VFFLLALLAAMSYSVAFCSVALSAAPDPIALIAIAAAGLLSAAVLVVATRTT